MHPQYIIYVSLLHLLFYFTYICFLEYFIFVGWAFQTFVGPQNTSGVQQLGKPHEFSKRAEVNV